MNQLPEELEAMAYFFGESKALDSKMLDKSVGLATDANTIRSQIAQFQQMNRPQQAQPRPPAGYQTAQVVDYTPVPSMGTDATHIPWPNPPIQAPMPQYTPPYQYTYPPHQESTPNKDVNQLEFNLEPDKVDIIINLLKEINIKLGKLSKPIDEKIKTEKKPVPKVPQGNLNDQ